MNDIGVLKDEVIRAYAQHGVPRSNGLCDVSEPVVGSLLTEYQLEELAETADLLREGDANVVYDRKLFGRCKPLEPR